MAEKLKRLDVRCFSKIQMKSRAQNLSNERALKICSAERCPLKSLRRRRLQFVGHVMKTHELEHLSLTGKIDGSRAREIQRATFMSQFQRSADHLFQMTLKTAEYRECIQLWPPIPGISSATKEAKEEDSFLSGCFSVCGQMRKSSSLPFSWPI